jgi:hypothetical protein
MGKLHLIDTDREGTIVYRGGAAFEQSSKWDYRAWFSALLQTLECEKA